MKKTILLISLLLTSIIFLFAAENNNSIGENLEKGYANTNDAVVGQGTYGQKVLINKDQQQSYMLPKPPPTLNWDREKILMLKQANKEKANGTKYIMETGQTNFFVNPAIIQGQKQQIQSQQAAQATQDYLNTRIANTIKGSCIIGADVMVSAKPQQIKVSCRVENSTDNHEYISLILMLIPDNQAYVLNAVPLYYIDSKNQLTKADQTMSHITNIDDTSSNIASSVNTQEIKKSINYIVQGAASGMATAGQSALQTLNDSKKEELQTVVGGATSTVVETTNTKKPTSDDYIEYGLVGAAMGVMQGLAKVAENMTTQELPWLYYINKGSLINFYITPSSVTQKQIYETTQTQTSQAGVQQ